MSEPSRRICASCKFFVPGYVGPQTIGFCVWRETFNRPAFARMNHGSHFRDSQDRRTREVNGDASCAQWVDKE